MGLGLGGFHEGIQTSETRFSNDLWAHNPNLAKTSVGLVKRLMILSIHNYAHDTTADKFSLKTPYYKYEESCCTDETFLRDEAFLF